MGERKGLSIGITVNLDNFENIRLEVTGSAESPREAQELARFLDETLATLGRADPATAERIDNFRRRLFSPTDLAAGVSCPDNQVAGPPGLMHPDAEPAVFATPAAATRAEASPAAQATIPGPKVDQAGPLGDSAVCENCGATLSGTEKKMSQLFASRNLCRRCIKSAKE